jgi:ABC-2 type transport system permease protein
MKKTILVAYQEIYTTLRRKSFIFFTFGLPLIIGIIIGIVIFVNKDTEPGEDPSLPDPDEASVAGFVDEAKLIIDMPEEFPAHMLTQFENKSLAREALDADKIDGYYVIPGDYIETATLRYVTDNYDPISGNLNNGLIQYVLMANILGDAELASKVMSPVNFSTISLAPSVDPSIEGSWIVELLPNLMSFILYLVIIMSASILVTAMTDEKKNRVLEVLLSSISSTQLIAGKIIAVGFLGLLMISAWISVVWGVATFGGPALNIPAGFSIPGDMLFWAIVFAILGYGMYGSQMAGIGALVKDIKDSRGLTFVVLAPLILTYMFLVLIINNPDGVIAIILSFFPLTAPVAMVARMVVDHVPVWQPILSAVLQMITIIGIVRLIANAFRAQVLLSGQPASIGRFFSILVGKAPQ